MIHLRSRSHKGHNSHKMHSVRAGSANVAHMIGAGLSALWGSSAPMGDPCELGLPDF